ncbi:MAG: cysteine desulfurase [Clostridia bacterium]|nr:cysteine desulfurase [Clostridia bacterium]
MIYLDNSATTRVAPEVIEEMALCMENIWGNPSSTHAIGRDAGKAISKARKTVAEYLGVETGEIYFTSGGTESDNIAILGGANIKKGKRIVTTMIEHDAVLKTMAHLEDNGFEVIRIAPESDGSIDPDKVIEAVDDKTCLVSCMHVNNETGAIIDIERIAKGVRAKNQRVLVHTDAVQSFGHIETKPYKMGVDMMSISSHKIHGPKGVGVLFIRKGINDLKKSVFGGGQEKDIRPGTENTFGISGFAKAVELIDLKENERIATLRKKLKDELLALGRVHYNGCENASDYILNLSFEGVRSEVMLNALDSKGICVSSASACAGGKHKSYVLAAMKAKLADNAIRFSFSRYTTKEDIDKTIEAVKEIIKLFRR